VLGQWLFNRSDSPAENLQPISGAGKTVL